MATITAPARSNLIALTVGMFNAAPGELYLNDFVNAWNAGMSLSAIANVLDDSGAFNTVFPPLQTSTEFATQLINNLLGNEVAAADKAWAVDWVAGQINAGVSRGDVIVNAVTALLNTTNPSFANAQLAFNNKVAVAEYYSVTQHQSSTNLLELQAVITGVTSSAASVTAAKAFIDANLNGETFNLTITGDIFVGDNGNDKIFGNADTLSALDNIDGGGGIDTLTVLGVSELGAAKAIDFALPTVKNVENLVATASASGISNANFTSWTGLTSATFNTQSAAAVTVAATTDVKLTNTTAAAVSVTGGKVVSVTNGAGTIAVTGSTGLTTVNTTGGTTVTIDDAGAEADTLTTVSISGNTGAATIGSDKLTSLTLANSNQDATVTAAAGTRVLGLTVNKMTGGVITDAQATTVNISSTGAASTGLTLTAGEATAVTIAADEALTLADVNIGKTKTITVTGDSKVTISALTGVAALTAIDASASTSGMTITPLLGLGVAYTGGAGVDTLKLGAHTKAVALGAGNDVVTITAAMGTGGTVTGGDGTDTVIFDGAAVSLTGVTGFEILGLGANATGAYVATGFTGLTLGAVAAAVSFGSVAAGTTLTITADPGVGNTVAYTLADATGTSDSLPLTITGKAAIAVTEAITAAGVETIAITSDDANTTLGNITHEVEIAGNDAKTITVGGDAGLILEAASTKLTSFDASGMTNSKVGVEFATGVLAGAATLTGSGGDDILDASATTKAVTINGGAGADTIIVGIGAATISAGDGNDKIHVGASEGLVTIDVGAGTDTVYLEAAPSAGGFYTSITGMTAGDKINFAAVTDTASAGGALGEKITLGGASSFANYLDAATATLMADNDPAIIKWFQFQGNTYVVVDNEVGGNDTTTFQDGVDSVIELVGLVDLSTSTVAADVLTLV